MNSEMEEEEIGNWNLGLQLVTMLFQLTNEAH